MTQFNAQAYASGLTVATFNADLDAGTITKAQAKATVAAKLSRDSMKPSARKRWTRVADMLETAGTINTHVAFRGAQADAKAAVKAVKAHVEARKEPNAEQREIAQVERDVSVLDRARDLLGKKILSKANKGELDAILTAYVRG
jgi:3-deoxy-D-arabino-heptulosonate 7-phosphate (DAHP) synthase